jgi:hypothetical protein
MKLNWWLIGVGVMVAAVVAPRVWHEWEKSSQSSRAPVNPDLANDPSILYRSGIRLPPQVVKPLTQETPLSPEQSETSAFEAENERLRQELEDATWQGRKPDFGSENERLRQELKDATWQGRKPDFGLALEAENERLRQELEDATWQGRKPDFGSYRKGSR